MKKYCLLTIIFACFISAISFAQMDSSDYRKSQKQMMKAEQRRLKQEKRVKRANAKMEKSQKRLNKQNRKLNKANRRSNNEMRDMNREQQKLEESRKDSVPNTSYIIKRNSNSVKLQSEQHNIKLSGERYYATKQNTKTAI